MSHFVLAPPTTITISQRKVKESGLLSIGSGKTSLVESVLINTHQYYPNVKRPRLGVEIMFHVEELEPEKISHGNKSRLCLKDH